MNDSNSQVTRLYVRWKDGTKDHLFTSDPYSITHAGLVKEIRRLCGSTPRAVLFAVK